MSEIQIWGLWLKLRAIQALQERHQDERGASMVEMVIITALFAAAAITISAIIIAKFTGKANSIPTG